MTTDLFVVLGSDGLRLALPAFAVREITAVPAAVPLPAVPAHVIGITSWRAAPLPVIDLLAALSNDPAADQAPVPEDERSRLVVIEVDRVRVGLRVPRVYGVRGLSTAAAPTLLTFGRLKELVVGEVQEASGPVGILDGSKLLAAVRP